MVIHMDKVCEHFVSLASVASPIYVVVGMYDLLCYRCWLSAQSRVNRTECDHCIYNSVWLILGKCWGACLSTQTRGLACTNYT